MAGILYALGVQTARETVSESCLRKRKDDVP